MPPGAMTNTTFSLNPINPMPAAIAMSSAMGSTLSMSEAARIRPHGAAAIAAREEHLQSRPDREIGDYTQRRGRDSAERVCGDAALSVSLRKRRARKYPEIGRHERAKPAAATATAPPRPAPPDAREKPSRRPLHLVSQRGVRCERADAELAWRFRSR